MSSAESFSQYAKRYSVWTLKVFFFYLGFKALSRIFLLYRADRVHQRWAKTGEPAEKPPDHP